MKNRAIIIILSLLWLTDAAAAQGIIPKPRKQTAVYGMFQITPTTTIVALDDERQLASYLNRIVNGTIMTPLRIASKDTGINYIRLTKDGSLPVEGYVLNVAENRIEIRGGGYGGLFYGIQTLRQLMEPQNGMISIQCQTVEDSPAMEYRGVMLDVARTFVPKEEVMRFIDLMAMHKLNKFHWHLSDDEGWRIEIKKYPELTSVGGFRGKDSPIPAIYGKWGERYGGYYTQGDIREIVEFARVRNVEVIPEIDLPGHSRTAAKVYPRILCKGGGGSDDMRNVWCASKEENYAMLGNIIAEICGLFTTEYIHLGGDEVPGGQWKACADCQSLMKRNGMTKTGDITAYFMERLKSVTDSLGKTLCVWNEAANNGVLSKDVRIYGWEGVKQCLDVTAKGYKTIVMPGNYFYLDMRQCASEDGQVWARAFDAEQLYAFSFPDLGFNGERMKNVAGIEAAFWSELLLSHDMEWLYHQTYPRLCAHAEVAWCEESAREWTDFSERFDRFHAARLSDAGVGFHAAPETVKGEFKFTVKANSTYTTTVAASELFDADGLWYIRLNPLLPDIRLNKLVVKAGDKTYNVAVYPQTLNGINLIKFNTGGVALEDATIEITVTNPNTRESRVGIYAERSPYAEPAVAVTTSMGENAKHPLSRAAKYEFNSNARTSRPCKKDDYVLYTFNTPVEAESIEVNTGLYYMPRYLIPFGYVEVSYDGSTFIRMAYLDGGRAVIRPDLDVRAVRVVSTSDGNGENAVALQPLKIIMRNK